MLAIVSQEASVIRVTNTVDANYLLILTPCVAILTSKACCVTSSWSLIAALST